MVEDYLRNSFLWTEQDRHTYEFIAGATACKKPVWGPSQVKSSMEMDLELKTLLPAFELLSAASF